MKFKRILGMVLAVLMLATCMSFTMGSVSAVSKTVYVNGNAAAGGDGTTEAKAYNTFAAAWDDVAQAGGKIILTGETHIINNKDNPLSECNYDVVITATDPSTYLYFDGMAGAGWMTGADVHFTGGTGSIKFENITLHKQGNWTNVYLNGLGLELGEGITINNSTGSFKHFSYPMFVAGEGAKVVVRSGAHPSMNSTTYTDRPIYAAGVWDGTAYDVNVEYYGGSHNIDFFASDGGGANKVKNVNILLDAMPLTLKATRAFAIEGAFQVIANNGVDVSALTFAGIPTATGGKWIVSTATGGRADFTTTPGTFKITSTKDTAVVTPEGGTPTEYPLTKNGSEYTADIALAAGTYTVTYKSAPKTVYVNDSAAAGGDGTTEAKAFNSFATAWNTVAPVGGKIILTGATHILGDTLDVCNESVVITAKDASTYLYFDGMAGASWMNGANVTFAGGAGSVKFENITLHKQGNWTYVDFNGLDFELGEGITINQAIGAHKHFSYPVFRAGKGGKVIVRSGAHPAFTSDVYTDRAIYTAGLWDGTAYDIDIEYYGGSHHIDFFQTAGGGANKVKNVNILLDAAPLTLKAFHPFAAEGAVQIIANNGVDMSAFTLANIPTAAGGNWIISTATGGRADFTATPGTFKITSTKAAVVAENTATGAKETFGLTQDGSSYTGEITLAAGTYTITYKEPSSTVYVDGTAATNGDGLTEATPFNNFTDAWNEIVAGGGTIILTGATHILGDTLSECNTDVVITAKDPGIYLYFDGKAGASAASGANVTFAGGTGSIKFENITLYKNGNWTYVYLNGLDLELGEGITIPPSTNNTYKQFSYPIFMATGGAKVIVRSGEDLYGANAQDGKDLYVASAGVDVDVEYYGGTHTLNLGTGGSSDIAINSAKILLDAQPLDVYATKLGSITGTFQMIANNGVTKPTLAGIPEATGGSWILTSTADGRVDFTTTAGQFTATSATYNYAIFTNTATLQATNVTLTSDGTANVGTVTLPAGEYTVTYDNAPVPVYTVTVDYTMGGVAIGGGTLSHGAYTTLSATPSVGYKLDGWFIGDRKISNANTFRYQAVDGDVTITAKFVSASSAGSIIAVISQKFNVVFDTDGGSEVATQQVVLNGKAKKPAKDPVKAGYVFDGWYTNKSYAKRFAFNNVTITKDTVVVAKWIKVNDIANRILLTVDNTEADVFGKKIINDVAPVIKNGRTMLPARFIAENLGASVEWTEWQRKVVITSADKKTIITIFIDSNVAYVNGVAYTLDSAAFIENGRTYTPVRFVAEALGATVEWKEGDREVVIFKK